MVYINKEKAKTTRARWKAANREKLRAQERARYDTNKKEITANKRKWRNANRHKDAAYRTKVRATVYGRAAMLHDNAKQRAKKKDIVFRLSLEYVIAGIAQVFCPKTGVMFDLSKSGSRTNPFAPSLDRIDSTKPYVDANVQVVAWFYNHMKHEHSETVLLDLCARILEHAR